jgi:hypothetical protein
MINNRDLGEAYRCGVTAAAATTNSGHIHSTSIGNGDKTNDDIAVSAAMASINAQQVKTSDIYNQVR